MWFQFDERRCGSSSMRARTGSVDDEAMWFQFDESEDGMAESDRFEATDDGERGNNVGDAQGHWDPVSVREGADAEGDGDGDGEGEGAEIVEVDGVEIVEPLNEDGDFEEMEEFEMATTRSPAAVTVTEPAATGTAGWGSAAQWISDDENEDKKKRKRERRMKRRSRSKLLRPFKELKRLDPFNRRLMEEAEGIDTAYIEAVSARRHDDGGVRPNAQRTRSVPDFPRSELTVHGVPDYAQSGYQGVDISSFDLESILSADADDKMPYDKYGLSAPIMAKPDDIAPPKAVAVAPSQSAPKSKAKPLPAADPKAAAPATAGGVKPGDSKPEETAKAVPPPKEEGPKLEAVAPPKSGAEAPTTDGVEWPDVGDSSSTKYGVPDYSNGFEGDDAANIPSADSDSPPQSESDSMEMAEDEASRHNTEIAIYYLVAGQSLFEHNTVSGAKPHAPAIAKPFHIIDDFRCDDD